MTVGDRPIYMAKVCTYSSEQCLWDIANRPTGELGEKDFLVTLVKRWAIDARQAYSGVSRCSVLNTCTTANACIVSCNAWVNKLRPSTRAASTPFSTVPRGGTPTWVHSSVLVGKFFHWPIDCQWYTEISFVFILFT